MQSKSLFLLLGFLLLTSKQALSNGGFVTPHTESIYGFARDPENFLNFSVKPVTAEKATENTKYPLYTGLPRSKVTETDAQINLQRIIDFYGDARIPFLIPPDHENLMRDGEKQRLEREHLEFIRKLELQISNLNTNDPSSIIRMTNELFRQGFIQEAIWLAETTDLWDLSMQLKQKVGQILNNQAFVVVKAMQNRPLAGTVVPWLVHFPESNTLAIFRPRNYFLDQFVGRYDDDRTVGRKQYLAEPLSYRIDQALRLSVVPFTLAVEHPQMGPGSLQLFAWQSGLPDPHPKNGFKFETSQTRGGYNRILYENRDNLREPFINQNKLGNDVKGIWLLDYIMANSDRNSGNSGFSIIRQRAFGFDMDYAFYEVNGGAQYGFPDPPMPPDKMRLSQEYLNRLAQLGQDIFKDFDLRDKHIAEFWGRVDSYRDYVSGKGTSCRALFRGL